MVVSPLGYHQPSHRLRTVGRAGVLHDGGRSGACSHAPRVPPAAAFGGQASGSSSGAGDENSTATTMGRYGNGALKMQSRAARTLMPSVLYTYELQS